jgi:hypothetical protein
VVNPESRVTALDDTARLAACQKAAGLYRGPLADGAGYEWAEPYAEAARRRALAPGPASPSSSSPLAPTRHWPRHARPARRGPPTLRLLETRLSELGVTPGPRPAGQPPRSSACPSGHSALQDPRVREQIRIIMSTG